MKSLTIDTRHVVTGRVPEPVFSGELSALALADPEDDYEWVCLFIDLSIDSSLTLFH